MSDKDLMSIYRPHAEQWLKKNYDSEYTKHHIESLAYLLASCYADGDNVKAEKSLLEKTADWHEHGTVAPSCVGCPTAKAMIEGDWVMVKQGMLLTYISCAVVFSSERMTEAERRKEVDRIFALFTEGSNDG